MSEFAPTYLGTVEDVFEIRGRGCVVVPDALATPVEARTQIELRRPEGSVVRTEIIQTEPIKKGSDRVAFMIAPGLGKSEIPKGTQIWRI